MKQLQVTFRTKEAVRRWADLPGSHPIFLDTELSDLNPDIDALLLFVNEEFENDPKYPGFPITAGEWDNLDPETVRDVRDEVVDREEGS